MKTIVLTGGGSPGHVRPNIALIPSLREQGIEVNYIGTDGIEKELLKEFDPDLPFHEIKTERYRRYFSLENLRTPLQVISGIYQSYKLLSEINPEVVFSRGGFVSAPVVWAAALLKIPSVIHESNSSWGLANLLNMPFSEKVCYSFTATEINIIKKKAVLTGVPIGEEFFLANSDKGREFVEFSDKKPILLIVGNSLEHEILNDTVRNSLDILLSEFQICYICGHGNIDETQIREGYRQIEFSDTIYDLMAMADVVVSRAGSIINELLALKKPNVLIPLSRKLTRGDQIQNAQYCVDEGYSIMIYPNDLNPKTFVSAVQEAYSQREIFKDRMGSFQDRAKTATKNVIEILLPYFN